MKKAKRILACILVVVMIAITLASCNSGEETKTTAKPTEKAQTTSKPTDAPQENESLVEDENVGNENGNTTETIYEEKAVINGAEFWFETNHRDQTTSTLIMINVTKDFEGVVLTLPSKTPSGKTITECEIVGLASNVPQLISKSDFESQILSKAENSQELTDYEKIMLKNFFKLRDLETYLEYFTDPEVKEKQKENFLKLYPFAEKGAFYEFTGFTQKEYSAISELLTKIGYTFEDNYLNNQKFEKETNYYVGYRSNVDSIEKITLPDTLTSLQINSFKNLKKVDISKNTSTINLRSCEALTEIEIPNTVKEYSFAYCSNLATVTIHDGVTTIGDSAFESCTSLVSISIPDSVTSIGSYAFDNCTSLEYNEYDNAYYLGNNNPYLWLIKAKDEDITSCNINENTKFICGSAFSRYTSLTSITVPDGVTSIGDNAFGYCSNLTSITIPNSVKSIGAAAFFCCTSLTDIIIPDSVTNIGSNAFYGCTSLEYNDYDNAYYLGNDNNPYLWLIKAKDQDITSCNINENTKFICSGYEISYTTDESGAFLGCRNLTCLTIPVSITFIDGGAFSDCENLTTINYTGTKAEWKAIEKENSWNDSTGNYIIHCTDGDIAKAEDN